MTIEHNADGTKQFTSAEGVITKHADLSAVLHFQQTGQRLAYDMPEGAAPAAPAAPASAAPAGGKNAVDLYKERCRNVGRARAQKTLLGGR